LSWPVDSGCCLVLGLVSRVLVFRRRARWWVGGCGAWGRATGGGVVGWGALTGGGGLCGVGVQAVCRAGGFGCGRTWLGVGLAPGGLLPRTGSTRLVVWRVIVVGRPALHRWWLSISGWAQPSAEGDGPGRRDCPRRRWLGRRIRRGGRGTSVFSTSGGLGWCGSRAPASESLRCSGADGAYNWVGSPGCCEPWVCQQPPGPGCVREVGGVNWSLSASCWLGQA
jgi:hypothetical protein